MKTVTNYPTLKTRPRQFFMSMRDISFWIQSARADAALTKFERKHGVERAFDQLYGGAADPWGYTNPHFRYQRLKYDKLLAMVPDRSYASALDIGCGIGMFTRALAPHVTEIMGVDIALEALSQARTLSQHLSNIQFDQQDLLTTDTTRKHHTSQKFDLIALVDVLYYLSPLTDARLKAVVATVEALLEPNGIVLLANHYFFGLDRQSRMVEEIHSAFRWAKPFHQWHQERQPFFLASVFQAQSAAPAQQSEALP